MVRPIGELDAALDAASVVIDATTALVSTGDPSNRRLIFAAVDASQT